MPLAFSIYTGFDTISVEPLGTGNGRRILRGSGASYGLSRLLGLVCWGRYQGQGFYKLGVRPIEAVSEAMHERRVAEFDQMIASDPLNDLPHRRKVLYLLYGDRPDEAKQACLDWIRTHPRSVTARIALGDVLRQIQSGLHPDQIDSAWLSYPHPTFAARGIFRVRDLRAAQGLPFAADATEWCVAEAYALIAVLNSYFYGQYREVVESCDLWENACRSYGGCTDMSYLTVRAAARLRLGEFEAAQADVEAALELEAAGSLWAGGARELLDAIRARNPDYEYDERKYRPDTGWFGRLSPDED